jgi:hypothetical protein
MSEFIKVKEKEGRRFWMISILREEKALKNLPRVTEDGELVSLLKSTSCPK